MFYCHIYREMEERQEKERIEQEEREAELRRQEEERSVRFALIFSYEIPCFSLFFSDYPRSKFVFTQ